MADRYVLNHSWKRTQRPARAGTLIAFAGADCTAIVSTVIASFGLISAGGEDVMAVASGLTSMIGLERSEVGVDADMNDEEWPIGNVIAMAPSLRAPFSASSMEVDEDMPGRGDRGEREGGGCVSK